MRKLSILLLIIFSANIAHAVDSIDPRVKFYENIKEIEYNFVISQYNFEHELISENWDVDFGKRITDKLRVDLKREYGIRSPIISKNISGKTNGSIETISITVWIILENINLVNYNIRIISDVYNNKPNCQNNKCYQRNIRRLGMHEYTIYHNSVGQNIDFSEKIEQGLIKYLKQVPKFIIELNFYSK